MMEDRKRRLADLAARAGRGKAPPKEEDMSEQDAGEASTSTNNQRSDVKFRNYTPSDPSLQGDEDSKKRARTEDNSSSEPPKKKEKSALEEALEKAKKDLETNDIPSGEKTTELTTMAPKKVNWDLKRDIQPKLDKLERRTQKAIVQLLRERLAREADAAAAEEEGNDELD